MATAQPLIATGELAPQRKKLEVVENRRVHLGDPTHLGPRLDYLASSTSAKQPWSRYRSTTPSSRPRT
eukprot:6702995-Heterocapsa_arctica.AAC.1